MTTGLRSGFPVPTRDAQLGESLARRLEVVEQRLADAVTQTDELADSVSRHLVEAGGNRGELGGGRSSVSNVGEGDRTPGVTAPGDGGLQRDLPE